MADGMPLAGTVGSSTRIDNAHGQAVPLRTSSAPTAFWLAAQGPSRFQPLAGQFNAVSGPGTAPAMSSDLTASACAAALAGNQAPPRRRYHAVQVTKYAFGDPRTSDSSGVSNSHSTESSLVAPVSNTSTLCPPGDEHVESLLNSLMAIPPRRPAPPGPAGAQALARKLQRGASGTGLVGNGGGSPYAHEGLLPEAAARVAPGSLEAAAAMASVGQAHGLVQGGSQGPPGTTAGMASIGGIPHHRANHAAILKTAPAILTTRPPFHPVSHGLSSFSGGNSPVGMKEESILRPLPAEAIADPVAQRPSPPPAPTPTQSPMPQPPLQAPPALLVHQALGFFRGGVPAIGGAVGKSQRLWQVDQDVMMCGGVDGMDPITDEAPDPLGTGAPRLPQKGEAGGLGTEVYLDAALQVAAAEHYRAQLGASADLRTAAAAAAAAAQAGTHTTSLSGSEDEGKDEPATYVEQGRTAMKQDYLDEDATTDSEEEAQRRRARKRAASQRGRVSKAAAANERKEMCRERNRTAQRRFRERQRELIRVLQDKVDEQEALIRSLRKRLAIYEPPAE